MRRWRQRLDDAAIAKEELEPPGAGRRQDGLSPRALRDRGPEDTLVSNIMTS